MSQVCVLLAEGFEEIEAITIVDVLRRAGVDVTTLGVQGANVTGAHGISVRADATLDRADSTAWDLVVLPGGMPGSATLRDHPDVQALVRAQHAAGRRLAAICAAPIALEAAGVLAGRTATSYPGFAEQLPSVGCYSEDAVVSDGTVLTSRGPGTALAFALRLVEELVNAETAEGLRDAMLSS